MSIVSISRGDDSWGDAGPVIRDIREAVKAVKGIRSMTVCTAPAIEYT